MAENKRPTRPSYNYGSDTSKNEKNRLKRPTYDYESNLRAQKEAAKTARTRHVAQRPTQEPAAVPPLQEVSPFYGSQLPTHKKTAEQAQGYAEFKMPAHTVVTGTREIPQRPRTEAFERQNAGARRASGNNAHPLPRKNVAGGAGRNAKGGAGKGGKAKKKSVFSLFKKKPKTAEKAHKRPVVLADARAQRRRRNFYTTLGILAAVIIGVVLSLTVLFKIETIVVEGETPYTQEEIIAAFGHKLGDNLFAFHAEKVIETMQQKLPYLETIKIRRSLPSKVRIEVTSATDAYSISSVLGWVVLSESLRTLRIAPEEPAGVAHINGVEALEPALGMALQLEDADKLSALRQLQAEIQTQGLLPITEIDLSDTLNLNFIYAGRIRVIVGTSNELAAKIDWAKYLVTPSGEQSLAESEQGKLDVSGRNDEGRIEAVWRAGAI